MNLISKDIELGYFHVLLYHIAAGIANYIIMKKDETAIKNLSGTYCLLPVTKVHGIKRIIFL